MAAFDALLQRMDVVLLSVVAGEAATGIYDAAFQLVKVVMTLIMSFSEAIYPTLSRLYVHTRQQFALAIGKSLQYGLVLLLPLAVGATVLAEPIIALLYRRPEYAPAAGVLAVLSWALLPYFAQLLLTRTLMAGDRQRASLWVTGLMIAIGAVFMLALTYQFAAVGTAAALGLMYMVGAWLAWRASRGYDIAFGLSCLARPALAAALMGAGLYLMPSLPWWAAIPIGIVGYAALALGLGAFDRADIQTLRSALRR